MKDMAVTTLSATQTTLSERQLTESSPTASVIVLNHNGSQFLEGCLSSLAGQTFADFELIVVDNGSTDNSVKIAEDYVARGKIGRLRLIANPRNLGYSEGNNVGAAHALGKYLIFLNNDTYVHADWLRELVSFLEREPTVAACQSKIVLAETKAVQELGNTMDQYGFTSLGVKANRDQNVLIDEFFYVSGACFAVRKQLFASCGGFDKKLFILHEDMDLSWRLRLLGHKLACVCSSVCYHFGGGSLRRISVPTLRYYDVRNRLRVLLKNYALPTNVGRILLSVAFGFLELAFSAVKLKEPRTLSLWTNALLWNVHFIGDTLAERRRVQSMRQFSESQIIRLMDRDPFVILQLKMKLK